MEPNTSSDIFNTLISEEFIAHHLPYLFPDSLLLNMDGTIQHVNSDLSVLGFQPEEIIGTSINRIGGNKFDTVLHEKLRGGYFNAKEFTFLSKSGVPVNYVLSGFYLGIILAYSPTIVLRLSLKSEHLLSSKMWETSCASLDQFIYRASHDLRGPLATILGLINLLKNRSDLNNPTLHLLDLMELYAKDLDDKLQTLRELSAIEKNVHNDCYIHFPETENFLHEIIATHIIASNTRLRFHSNIDSHSGVNRFMIHALLENLLRHFLQFSSNEDAPEIGITIQASQEGLLIQVHSQHLEFEDDMGQILQEITPFPYTLLLQKSHLSFFLMARKKTLQLQGTMGLRRDEKERLVFLISIPLITTV